MTNYRKGVAFEFRVRDLFRRHGYAAERKAASSPYDIIVMKDGMINFVIDAKKTSQKGRGFIYIKRADVEKILKESRKLGAKPLIVYGFQRSPAFVAFPEKLIERDVVKLEPGLELKTFLGD
jgi:Holliday junction resolvase